MMFCPKKGGSLHNLIMHYVIWANQNAESFAYFLYILYIIFLAMQRLM